MSNTNEEVAVKFGIQEEGVDQGLSEVVSSLKASVDAMTAKIGELGAAHRKVVPEVESGNQRMGFSFLKLRDSTKEGLEGVIGVIETFKGKLALFTGILAGGAIFKESIDAVVHMRDEVRTLENVMGMGSEEATQYAIALKLVGSSAEAYTGIALKVARSLKSDSDEFTRLGIATKDAAGNTLPLEQIMENAFQRMQDFKAGTDQAEFAVSVFGRSVGDVYKLMVSLPAVQQRAIEMQKELGIEMGPQRQKEVGAYKVELAATKLTLEAMAEKIGEAILPMLQKLAGWFNSIGPAAIEVIEFSIKGLISILQGLGTAVGDVTVIVAAGLNQWGTFFAGVGRAAVAGAQGDWASVGKIVTQTYASIVRTGHAAMDTIVYDTKAAAKKIGDIWADTKKPDSGPGPLKSGKESFVSKPKSGGAEESEVGGFENILKAAENAYNNLKLQQGSFEVWSIQMTRDYWQEVLDSANLSAKDRLAIENKFYDAERKVQQEAFAATIAKMEAEKAALGANVTAKIAIAEREAAMIAQRYGAESKEAEAAYKKIAELRQQLADQRMRIAQIEAKQEEAIAQHSFDMQKLGADQALALRQIDSQQRFALEQQFEDRLYAMKRAAIDRELELEKSGPDDPVKVAALQEKLLELELQYQTKKTQIANQAELDRKQYALEGQQAVESEFSNFLSSLGDKTKSLTDKLKSAFDSLNQSLLKIASNQIAKQLFGPGTAGGNAVGGIMDKIFGGGGGAAAGAGAAAGGASAATTATAMTALTTATTADTAATTAASTATTLQTSMQSALSTVTSALTTALAALTSSAASAAAALATVGAGGGAGALFGEGTSGSGLFDLTGGLTGIPFLADGTNYVPSTTLAVLHKGEAVVPAKYNNGDGGGNRTTNTTTHVHINGPVDTRSRNQIAAAAYEGTRRGVAKNR